PMLVGLAEPLGAGLFIAQEILGKKPPFIGRKCFGTDQHDCSALVVLANRLANTGTADPRADDEIIAPNHFGSDDRKTAASLARQKLNHLLPIAILCAGPWDWEQDFAKKNSSSYYSSIVA